MDGRVAFKIGKRDEHRSTRPYCSARIESMECKNNRQILAGDVIGKLPDMNRTDARRTRAALNHLSFKNNLEVLAFPVAWNLRQHLFHMMVVDEKFTGGHGSPSADTRGYHYELICIGIHKARYDGVVFVHPGLDLLRALQHPVALAGVCAVLDPEAGHLGIVREMETQRGG